MGYFDKYKTRVASSGNSIGEAHANATKHFIGDRLKDSPFYRQADIEGTLYDVRVVDGKDSALKILYFMPETKIDVGSFVTVDAVKYIVTDFVDNDIFPKAMIQRCGESLIWKDSSGTVFNYPCSLTKSSLGKFNVDQNVHDVFLLQGSLFIYTEYNADTQKILPKQRFILGSQVWEVVGIDDITFVYNGKGVTQYTVQVTTKNDLDDFSNKIADNSHLYVTGQDNSTGGGNLW